jgi:hypothetical protein
VKPDNKNKKESTMKKVLLAAVVTAGLCGSLFAKSANEYGDLTTWLQKYYCQQYNVTYLTPNDPGYDEAKRTGSGMFSMPVSAWSLQDEMWRKIQLEYPMPADLQAAVTEVKYKEQAELLALAQKYGYSSYLELFNHIKTDPKLNPQDIITQENEIKSRSGSAQASLTETYRQEFNARWQATVIEAIKRIQENAQAMNPKQ